MKKKNTEEIELPRNQLWSIRSRSTSAVSEEEAQ